MTCWDGLGFGPCWKTLKVLGSAHRLAFHASKHGFKPAFMSHVIQSLYLTTLPLAKISVLFGAQAPSTPSPADLGMLMGSTSLVCLLFPHWVSSCICWCDASCVVRWALSLCSKRLEISLIWIHPCLSPPLVLLFKAWRKIYPRRTKKL